MINWFKKKKKLSDINDRSVNSVQMFLGGFFFILFRPHGKKIEEAKQEKTWLRLMPFPEANCDEICQNS